MKNIIASMTKWLMQIFISPFDLKETVHPDNLERGILPKELNEIIIHRTAMDVCWVKRF